MLDRAHQMIDRAHQRKHFRRNTLQMCLAGLGVWSKELGSGLGLGLGLGSETTGLGVSVSFQACEVCRRRRPHAHPPPRLLDHWGRHIALAKTLILSELSERIYCKASRVRSEDHGYK